MTLLRKSAVSGIAFSLALMLISKSAAHAQNAGRDVELSGKPERESFLEEPVAYRVYQRDRNDRAEIAVAIHSSRRDVSLVAAQLSGLPEGAKSNFADGRFSDVPTGGPYRLIATVKVAGHEETMTVGPLFVGDLWVLAGQSNMVGYGDLIDVVPPHPKVMALGMDGRWVRAQEPLHWEIDAIDPVHLDLLGPAFADPAARARFSQDQHKGRGQGAGLGIPFAVNLAEQTGVPIGLLTCAHGGTSMSQWSPAKKGEGGRSLYGSMLLHIQRAGGHVKGLLWWQGESDAGSSVYFQTFADFIAALRDDLGQPEFPVYFVQITRLVYGDADIDPRGRNPVREAQRLIPKSVSNTAVVSAIDLDLSDLGHVGTEGLKRLGRRLALVALRELYGQKGATSPNLEKVTKVQSRRGLPDLVVKFRGVNRRAAPLPSSTGNRATGGATAVSGEWPALGLQPTRHIAGFSVRRLDGTEIPLIFDAVVGPTPDSVTLKPYRAIPEGAQLWYGYGLDPYCNLTDSLDMAIPAFGPVVLDDVK